MATYIPGKGRVTVSGAKVGTDAGTQLATIYEAGDPSPFSLMWDGENNTVTKTGEGLSQQQADTLNKITSIGGTITAYKGSGIGGGTPVIDLPPDSVYNLSAAELRTLSNIKSTEGESSIGPTGLALMKGGVSGDGTVNDPVAGYSVTVPDVEKVKQVMTSGVWNPQTGIQKTFKVGDVNPNTGRPMSQLDADSYNKQIAAGKTTPSGQAIPQNQNPAVSSTGTTSPSSSTGTQNVSGATNATSGASGATNATGATTGATAQNSPDSAAAMGVLNKYLNEGVIDSSTYQFFKKAIDLWNPDQEIDYANILNTFEQVKQTDIDPYFKEQANIFIDEVQRNKDYLQQNRALEVDDEGRSLAMAKRNAQENLSASGLWSSGESVRQLGNEGTYAEQGTVAAQKSAIPTMATYGGGELQKQAQAAASSTQLRYENSLKDLQRQAEQTLGTTGSEGIVPGVKSLGGVTGSMVSQQKQAQASALSNIYSQSGQNTKSADASQYSIFNE